MDNVEIIYQDIKFTIPGKLFRSLVDADFSEEQICLMLPKERFLAFCEWEGLLGSWGEDLWDITEVLHK